jgi:hypothetical protein
VHLMLPRIRRNWDRPAIRSFAGLAPYDLCADGNATHSKSGATCSYIMDCAQASF